MTVDLNAGMEGRAARLVTKRGSSKLEGLHFHLGDLLCGNNYSPELAHFLIIFFIFRWNVKRGIERCDDPDHGITQLWLAEGVQVRFCSLRSPAPLCYPKLFDILFANQIVAFFSAWSQPASHVLNDI
jgi:hypothetical protein